MSPMADHFTDAGTDGAGELLPDREGMVLVSDPAAAELPAFAGPSDEESDAGPTPER